jgi:Holliday junction resolvasome RuvABC endonuclease subunit
VEAKYSRILSLDLSTKSGWAVFVDGVLEKSGELEKVDVVNFNVNDKPWTQPEYPWNVMQAARLISEDIEKLILQEKPTFIVIENSVKGKNSQTQRLIEWFHFTVLTVIKLQFLRMAYMMPSEWRSAVNLRLSKDEKKNNRDVSAGKKRGKITRKHLSVNMVNQLYPNLELILKNNDQADAILLGLGFISKLLDTSRPEYGKK